MPINIEMPRLAVGSVLLGLVPLATGLVSWCPVHAWLSLNHLRDEQDCP